MDVATQYSPPLETIRHVDRDDLRPMVQLTLWCPFCRHYHMHSFDLTTPKRESYADPNDVPLAHELRRLTEIPSCRD